LRAVPTELNWQCTGSGPCVVLVHGWALSSEYWDLLTPLLEPHFQVLRFDRRGFGRSSGRPSLATDRDDLLRLLDAVGADKATLVGMSQGARVVMSVAATAPQRVAALILDGPPEWDAEPELPIAHYQHLLQTAGNQAMRQAISAHPLLKLHRPSQQAAQILARTMQTYSGQDLLAFAPESASLQPASIRAPTLILNGEFDTDDRQAAGAHLQQDIAGARRTILAEAGHLAALEQPIAYSEVIKAFHRTAII
jgi:3-oxoadipate enol-lactonase